MHTHARMHTQRCTNAAFACPSPQAPFNACVTLKQKDVLSRAHVENIDTEHRKEVAQFERSKQQHRQHAGEHWHNDGVRARALVTVRPAYMAPTCASRRCADACMRPWPCTRQGLPPPSSPMLLFHAMHQCLATAALLHRIRHAHLPPPPPLPAPAAKDP